MNPKTLPQTNLMAEISQGVLQINNNMIFMLYLTLTCLLNLTFWPQMSCYYLCKDFSENFN